MVAFISALSLEGKAPSTIMSYIAGVAYMHKVNNWQDPTKSFIIQKLIEGSKRLNGRPDGRAPLTLNVLVDVLNTLHKVCSSTYETLLFRSAFSLTFLGFLRVGEVTTRNRADTFGRAIAISDIALAGPGRGGLYKSVSGSLKLTKGVDPHQSPSIGVLAVNCAQSMPLKSFLMFVQSPPALYLSISSGVSHSDGSCVLGRIHSDVSSNIPKKVYHIVTDNFVNLLHISYA